MNQQEKIDAIYDIVVRLDKAVAINEIHVNQQRKELNTLTEKTENIEADRNKAYGFITLIGIVGTAFFTWLFKHF
jgi:hypothetical protein